jgi:hypothetical protein
VNATVVLDGSLTTDIENDPLAFHWIELPASVALGTGVRFTSVFSTGLHTVSVLVDDGIDSGVGAVTFEVITPGEGIEEVVRLLDGANLPRRGVRPLLATLKATIASFDRGSLHSGASQLRAFLNKVRAQIAPQNPVLAAQLSTACQTILDAVGASE